MRKRPRRKQPQPSSIIGNEEHASAVCDPSLRFFPSYCVPLFYLLLFAWIALFALNSAFSYYTGNYPLSVPWLNGVHADISSGEHKAARNAFALDTQYGVLPINESTTSNLLRSSQPKHTDGLPVSAQHLKCRPLLFKDFLFPPHLCYHSPNDGKKKRLDSQVLSRGLRSTSDSVCKDKGQATSSSSSSSSSSIHANDIITDAGHTIVDNFEFPQAQKAGPLYDSGEHLGLDLPEGPSSHVNINGHDEIGQTKQADNGWHDKSSMSEDNHTDTSPPCNGASVNENVSALVTSDVLNKTHPSLTNLSRIHLRQEPGDGPYNYASQTKGAKILASNKEAKGASNILNKDKDKYFRTPCNVEAKYVDMELSEETLVVELVIANHEFYSSNVREFSLWGSLTYPTEEWVLLGKFQAENSRVSQTFRLKDPQWVRYLKLQMHSHYGTDFYCTLSAVEVYGVDAIEWFLEDWIAEELGGLDSHASSTKENSSDAEMAGLPALAQGQVADKDTNVEEDIDSMLTRSLEDTTTEKSGNPPEGKGKNMEKSQPVYHQTGRPALDAVMKLLMQKVRTLEHKQPSLSRSLDEMEARYREVLGAHSSEAAAMMSKMDSIATEIVNLNALLQFMEGEWKRERHDFEEDIFHQVKAWNANFEFLRYELKRTEDKELVALAVAFFSLVTVAGIHVVMLCLSAFQSTKQKETILVSCSKMLRAIPLLSCIIVVFVLSL